MQQYFLVADVEIKPQVYIKLTTNWVGLTVRYVVNPKSRRAGATFLYRTIVEEIQQRSDIEIGTDTREVTFKRADPDEGIRRKKNSRLFFGARRGVT